MSDQWIEQHVEEWAQLFQEYPSGISVATRLAQFILESNAGRSELYRQSYNGFGIKASKPWQGKRIKWPSRECLPSGQEIETVGEFRVYDDLAASVADHAAFFTSTPYREAVAYRPALQALSSEAEAQALSGVYASDPMYGSKLIRLIRDYQLERFNLNEADSDGQESAIFWVDRRDQALGGQARDRALSQITTIVWHYSAVARAKQRTIEDHERYWRQERGWDRGGYHYYIDSQGQLFWNYDWERMTWGVADSNHFCLHICVEANSKEDYSPAQVAMRDRITRYLMEKLGIKAQQVKGHWEVKANTACPGYNREEMDVFRHQLAQSLQTVQVEESSPNYLYFEGVTYELVKASTFKDSKSDLMLKADDLG